MRSSLPVSAMAGFCFTIGLAASAAPISTMTRAAGDFDAWMANENRVAVTRLNANISVPGARRGAIRASPSTSKPKYDYDWVRDGAMVMRAVFDRFMAGDALVATQMKDYVAFTRDTQAAASFMPAGLGEPRFNLDGSVNVEPWGRPQNDGPALRALTLIRYARSLIAAGDEATVERDLYTAEWPARSVIKADLEFVAHHWQERCIDLWEETMGHHFFTEAAQMAALREGASLAREMNDPGAANYYALAADQLEIELAKHWDPARGYYLSALDFSAGPDHQKPTQLDVSVLLAALFVEQPTGLLSIMDDRIIKTAEALEQMFAQLYPINAVRGDLGAAIGRYQEDTYFGGNPWVLTTAAYAEWNDRMAVQVASARSLILTSVQARYFSEAVGSMPAASPAASDAAASAASITANLDLAASPRLRSLVADALRLRGDSYLKRIRESAGRDGHLSEQFDLKTGAMLSARDLSWSYAAFLRASEARDEALAHASAHSAH